MSGHPHHISSGAGLKGLAAGLLFVTARCGCIAARIGCIAAVCVGSLAAVTLAGCADKSERTVTPVVHNDAYDIWPDSIDLHEGMILRAVSDSVMQIRVEGNTIDSIAAPAPLPGRMTFRSDYPILDFCYRLEASMPASGHYTVQTPYEIFLNPLQGDSAVKVLEARLRNGVVLPAQTSRVEWPVTNANAEWLLAASETAVALGKPAWTRTVVSGARTALDNDLRMAYSTSRGLFTGLPAYMALGVAVLPEWMSPADMSAISAAGINVAYCAALTNIEAAGSALQVSADTLRRAIKRELWLPVSGCISAMRYGAPGSTIALQSADNLAQATGIIAGVFPPAMSSAIMTKTPVTTSGVGLYQPDLPALRGHSVASVDPMLLQTAWTIAAARCGNDAACSSALGALFAREGVRLLGDRHQLPPFRSTFTALILRGFLGMRFTPAGVTFAPFVPESLPGEKHIGRLRYRDATLDITLIGTGSSIATFTIDGKPSDPFFPESVKGHHSIAITLAGASADPGRVNLQEEQAVAPIPPTVKWNDSRNAMLSHSAPHTPSEAGADEAEEDELESSTAFGAYLNGVYSEEFSRDDYHLTDHHTPAAVQFVNITEEGLSGFSCRPYLYVPKGGRILIYASEIAKTGTKILEDKKLSMKFVESNKYKNRNSTIECEVTRAGRYLMRVHYAAGLGVVNSQRRIALRQLRANGLACGIFFFPQLNGADVPAGSELSWQEMTAWSNTLVVELQKGANRLELRYLQVSPVLADPTANDVLYDLVEIVPEG